ncbi:MAG: hypothetical protein H0V66_13665, partial [Bdellovibrionales bacterium]|nr:hypothetical protein [Bdellovibrionales bacterium]
STVGGTTGGVDGSTVGGTVGGVDGSTVGGTTGGVDGSTVGGTVGGVDGSTVGGTTGGVDGSTVGGTTGGVTGSTVGGTSGGTTGGTSGGTTGGYGDCNNGHGNDLDGIDDSNPTVGSEPKCKREIFHQAAEESKKIDIVWIIDNSGSMNDEQAALGSNFSAFIDEFITKNVDFQNGDHNY